MRLAHTCFWLALVAWVGSVVFLSFVVAPKVFGALPRPDAGEVMAALFPPYYALGTVAGVVGLIASLLLWRWGGRSGPWAAVTIMLATMLAATAYAGGVVQPRAHALRPALRAERPDPGLAQEFARLHRLAVGLNGLVLVLGVASAAVAAASVRVGEP